MGFYTLYLICSLVRRIRMTLMAGQTATLYVSEVNLTMFKRYQDSIYTFICGIHLALFPFTLIMMFIPFLTPWQQAVPTGASPTDSI